MGGINIRPMDPVLLGKCMRLASRLRAEDKASSTDQQIAAYAAARAARKPWLSLAEAALELDVSQGRISQMIRSGTLTVRYHPIRTKGAPKQVRAADVFAYKTHPIKKTRTKK